MLSNLKIENIAIIESASIDFANGLNVLSGETGAGKSIIIDSLSAVLGERTSKELIRTGAETAKVTALFSDVPSTIDRILLEMDITPSEDKTLLIQRTINLDGRNVCKVNMAPVTVTMLKKLGKELISIHGQHDSQNLLNPECHYKYLDSLGDLDSIYNDYLSKYTYFSELYHKLKALETNEEEKNRRIDFLRFEIDEIESADIRIGEYDELCEKRSFFRNSEKIIEGLRNSLAALEGVDDESGIISSLFDVCRSLESSSAYMTSLNDIASSVSEITYNLQDKKDEIKNALIECDYDPAKQSIVEDRINMLFKLKSKYGETEEEILSYLEKEKSELSSIENADVDRAEITKQLESAKGELLAAAELLSSKRRNIASEFEVKVKNELTFLDMPHVELQTSFEHCNLNPVGSDVIEFLISPNVGESPKPLSKIASGGELSRIMLAIQNVLAAKGNVGTMIFDEIDTGVSGSAAEKIAIKLHEVARKHQVICITHSSQVAAYADEHFKISKEVVDNKTYTRVEKLDLDGRTKELARIIGGVNITELQLQSAKELLETAKKSK